MSETQLYQSYIKTGNKKWMLFLSYCVSEIVTSVDADFCAGSYDEDKYQDVAN